MKENEIYSSTDETICYLQRWTVSSVLHQLVGMKTDPFSSLSSLLTRLLTRLLSQALWRCLLLSHILAPEFLRNGFVSVRGLWSWPRAWLVNCNYSLSPLLSRFVTMQKTHPVYSCLSVPYSLTTTRILVQTQVQ